MSLSAEVVIRNRRGLHARASARLVTLVTGYDAQVWVAKDGEEVTGTSIMGLMMLAAAPGDSVTVRAEGVQAEAALKAVVELIEAKFGEE
ncbi:HPr family phosphocarrier protein [Sandaracinobacteroides saxicola]|uniref:HPr family phosphocarrier protein n=1 Tax=Sandaracinobacteroides saxicola TaxID=2759707 RepID=A0A7G5IJ87_9SPHN|nr:HPr family phosphocarrier protein [Sandaracinobacteroides saxicola]QMW23429.1 HPr family phosphocarrier protein [Sandaracinobacteroides saxicola]